MASPPQKHDKTPVEWYYVLYMESGEQSNNRPWLYKKGQSGNPSGRPKGSKTLKTYLKEKFEKMTDEEREVFFEGLDKKTLWEMGEGKAHQTQDVTSDGKALMVNVVSFKDADNTDTV